MNINTLSDSLESQDINLSEFWISFHNDWYYYVEINGNMYYLTTVGWVIFLNNNNSWYVWEFIKYTWEVVRKVEWWKANWYIIEEILYKNISNQISKRKIPQWILVEMGKNRSDAISKLEKWVDHDYDDRYAKLIKATR